MSLGKKKDQTELGVGDYDVNEQKTCSLICKRPESAVIVRANVGHQMMSLLNQFLLSPSLHPSDHKLRICLFAADGEMR